MIIMVPDGMNTGKLPYTRFFATNAKTSFFQCLTFNPSQKDRPELLCNALKTVKSDGFICD